MLMNKLLNYLDQNNVEYSVGQHPIAYTAQEIAACAHVSGKEFAKTVIVKIRGHLAMMVLPANYHIDFKRLTDALGTGEVYLVPEEDFCDAFPDCEEGAMPPLGNLYGLPVFVSKSLAEDNRITFNAGTHTDIITMDYEDFEWMTKPRVLSFTDRVRHELTLEAV